MFDFKKAIQATKSRLESTALMGIVLGPSGSGKSSLGGTFGVPTLYLFTDGEGHGPISARALGGDNVIPVCITQNDEGNPVDADTAYANLLYILNNIPAEIGAVVIDGMTEIETLIRSTKAFKKDCQTDKGKHNAFAEPQVIGDMIKPILVSLRSLKDRGIHSLCTCILEVSVMGDEGEFLESKPKLSTYSVVEGIIQGFPHVMVVGRMTKGDKSAYRLQFMTSMTRTSKNGAGITVKCINYRPRLAGFTEVPDTMPAKLSDLCKFLKGEKL